MYFYVTNRNGPICKNDKNNDDSSVFRVFMSKPLPVSFDNIVLFL